MSQEKATAAEMSKDLMYKDICEDQGSPHHWEDTVLQVLVPLLMICTDTPQPGEQGWEKNLERLSNYFKAESKGRTRQLYNTGGILLIGKLMACPQHTRISENDTM